MTLAIIAIAAWLVIIVLAGAYIQLQGLRRIETRLADLRSACKSAMSQATQDRTDGGGRE